jgi:hypothetical protein
VKVDREQLLNELSAVTPGLAKTETTEQSDCFVFKDDKVATFNEEIACWAPCSLKLTGAVRANALLTLLQKLKESTLEISVEKGEMKIRGTKGRRAGLKLEKEILLPIDSIKPPKHWQKLPEDFTEAVKHVQDCCGHDTVNKPVLTFVHMNKEFVEASDEFQGARFATAIETEQDILVRGVSIKRIIEMGMTEFGTTKSWVHFRTKDGTAMSCRRFIEEFPDMSGILSVKGKKITLPKGLAEAVDRANIFSSENSEGDKVLLRIEKGKLSLKGTGTSGWYVEPKKVHYNGPDLSFKILPSMLKYVATEHNECRTNGKLLKVDSGKFQYVAFLWVVGDKKEKKSKKKEKKP